MKKGDVKMVYSTFDKTGYFTTFDICRIFNMKRGRLKNWIEQGFLKPAYQLPDKRGKVSYFTKEQLYIVYLFRSLVDVGISRRNAGIWSQTFGYLKQTVDYPVNFVGFDLDGKSVKQVTVMNKAIIPPDQKFSHMLIINLSQIKIEVDLYLKAS